MIRNILALPNLLVFLIDFFDAIENWSSQAHYSLSAILLDSSILLLSWGLLAEYTSSAWENIVRTKWQFMWFIIFIVLEIFNDAPTPLLRH